MDIDILSPTQLKALCEKCRLQPSKKYGQNYLISPKPIAAMIEAGELTPKSSVIEIGPGFGVLTLAVAPQVKRVIAFEIEKKIEAYWHEKMEEYKNIEIVWGNALKELDARTADMREPFTVLANLPYQITSHALRTLLELENKPERIIVMVQKEVAERICANPGDMSLLAVSVQYYGSPCIITKVPKGSFWPAPKVDSAVLSIVPHENHDGGEAAAFFALAKTGFANKRKQLWKNLADGCNLEKAEVQDALKKVVGNEKCRAQELSVEQWRGLQNMLSTRDMA